MLDSQNVRFSKKFFVFTINILLGIIAVLLMRDRDKSKIIENLSNAEPDNTPAMETLPEGSLNNENLAEELVPDSTNVNINDNIAPVVTENPPPKNQNSNINTTNNNKNTNIAKTVNKNTNSSASKNTNSASNRKTRTS